MNTKVDSTSTTIDPLKSIQSELADLLKRANEDHGVCIDRVYVNWVYTLGRNTPVLAYVEVQTSERYL